MKLEFSLQIFEKKASYIKFHENSFSGSRSVPCRQKDGGTDGHEPNSRLSQCCESAYKEVDNIYIYIYIYIYNLMSQKRDSDRLVLHMLCLDASSE
jgi:hypothetical protein